jgi:hypothetical protein
MDQVGAADRLLQPEIPDAPDPAIGAVQEFPLLEIVPRHGTHNAALASVGAHPEKHLLVPGS